jgi:hypothetical protein
VTSRLVWIGVLALSAATSGCALAFDSTHLGVPVALADSSPPPAAATAFHITKHPVFFLWGMTTIGQPNLEDVLAGQVGTGGAVTNVRIRVRARWSDLLVTALTLGLASPRSVTFDGVIVPH